MTDPKPDPDAAAPRPTFVSFVVSRPTLLASLEDAELLLGEGESGLLSEAFFSGAGVRGIWAIPHPESEAARGEPLEIDLDDAVALAGWARENRPGGTTGWGPFFDRAMEAARNVMRALDARGATLGALVYDGTDEERDVHYVRASDTGRRYELSREIFRDEARPSLTDWKVGDDTLELLVQAGVAEEGTPFYEMVGKIAREVLEYRRRDEEAVSPDAAAISKKLEELGARLRYRDDPRGSGVQAALRVVEAQRRGTADRAIDELVAEGGGADEIDPRG